MTTDSSKACAFCGGQTRHPGWGHADARLCDSCGSATLPAGAAAEGYGEAYFTGTGEDGVDYQASKRQMQLINRMRLDFLRKKAGPAPEDARLFELGCALGFFLEAAQERGYQGWGVEISEWAAKEAAAKFGERIFAGTLEQAPVDWRGFDLAAAFHVLEHLEDPAAALKDLAARSKQGAYLLFEVPDFSSRRARRERDRWQYWLPGEHLNYFTKRGLRSLLEASGWETVAMKATSFTRLMGGVDRAGMRGLKEWVLKHLRWFSWIKKAVLALRGLTGAHDCVLVLARRKESL